MNSAFHAWIERHRPPGLVLDIGCGVHLHGTYGVDLLNGGDVFADGAALPIRHGAVDGVVCAQVLGYTVQNPIQVAREAHRVLKPGGELFVTFSRYDRSRINWPLLLRALDFLDVEQVRSPRWMWPYAGLRARRSDLPVGRDWDAFHRRHRWVPVQP